jgi:5-methylcytosine-specific restriction endonuclease McrA
LPISAENRRKYPDDWVTIAFEIKHIRAKRMCEGSPAYPTCRAKDGEPHPVTGSKVVLTVGHLNHDPTDNRPENLKAWCQRCHNTYDQPHRQANAAKTRRARKASGDLFDE